MSKTSHRFGDCELRPQQRQLLVGGQPAALGARAFDLLLTLIERGGGLVSKSDLLDAVWPGLVVEENNLTVQISALRKLIGASAIATIPGRGYRFAAALEGQDTATLSQAAPAPSPGPAPATAPGNLPATLPTLYGREDDLRAVGELLDRHRLVTLVGSGGIGKTRLGQAAAHALRLHWPDGAWIVELAVLSDPFLVAAAVAQALGISLAGELPAIDELAGALRPRRLLLVLDNCEHLLDAVCALVNTVAAAAPGIRIIATSQMPLKVTDEQQYRVPPLAVPASASEIDAAAFGAPALLEARVRAADRRFALGPQNLDAAIDICRRLDGLPLAIELAAMRVPVLGVRGVRDRLDERFDLLTRGSRTALPRHQTLRAALEWSHDLLGPVERTVYRRLSVFVGGFTLKLACRVVADVTADPAVPCSTLDEQGVVDALGTLVDLSLVAIDADESPRYRMLESPRLHARERVTAAGEALGLAKAHAREMLRHFEHAFSDHWSLTDGDWTGRYGKEVDNLRAALDWALAAGSERGLGVTLTAMSGGIWARSGLLAEGRARIDAALSCCDAETSALDLALLWRARGVMRASREPVDAAKSYERALARAEGLGQSVLVGDLWSRLARVRARQPGLLDAANDALARALDVVDDCASPRLQAQLADAHAFVLSAAGDFDGARRQFESAAALCRAAGANIVRLGLLDKLADLAWARGDLDGAESGFIEALSEMRRTSTTQGNLGVCLLNLAGVWVERGRQDRALEAAREGLPLMLADGHASYVLDHLALRAALCGRADDAALIAGHTDAALALRGSRRQANEARARKRLQELLADSLGPERREALLAAGRHIQEAEACRLALMA